MGLRNRIIAAYACWGITALGTTMTWTTRRDGASFSGQSGGLNGKMVLALALGSAALIAWWDRGGRFDIGRVRMAMFVGVLAIAVTLRNVYNIIDDPRFQLGFGIWICLGAAFPGVVLTRSIRKR